MEKKKKRKKIRFLMGVCCVTALFLWNGGGTAAARGSSDTENIKRYSETADSAGDLPIPDTYIRDENGKEYRLISSRIVNVPVTGRKKNLAGQIVYPEVSVNDMIPETAVLEVNDHESGTITEVELPLKETEYENERWLPGGVVTVTFHVYGADRYRFGDIRIPHSSGMPPLEMCGREILDEAGFAENEAEIESIVWDGDVYCGENGESCRDAAVSVKRKVWDCTAVYEGEASLPDYNRYRLLSEYEPVAELHLENSEKSGTIGPDSERKTDMGEEKVSRKIRWLTVGVTASLSLFLIFLLTVCFFRLRKTARKTDEMRP